MARPPLPVGTHGNINTKEEGQGKFRARCRYRHYDGKVYPVERYGSSQAQAERRLKEAIRDWVTPVAAGEFGPNTRFRDLAMAWLAEFERDADRGFNSWGSVDTYRNRLTLIVIPAIGALRAREVTGTTLDRVCQSTRDKMSASSAKIVKSVLGNICMFGVRVGAFETNPARDIGRIESKKARNKPAKPRAMTAAEVFELLGKLDTDDAARTADLPDLVRLFLGTGERTGEALAADWADFDPDAKQLTMAGNVIRATGKGRSSTGVRRRTQSGRSRCRTGARPCWTTGTLRSGARLLARSSRARPAPSGKPATSATEDGTRSRIAPGSSGSPSGRSGRPWQRCSTRPV